MQRFRKNVCLQRADLMERNNVFKKSFQTFPNNYFEKQFLVG
jgi:hypothetical protein